MLYQLIEHLITRLWRLKYYYIMGMGLGETDDTRKLGLFITCGGAKVKEVYMLNKSETKAKKEDGTTDVSEYQHARNVVDIPSVGIAQFLRSVTLPPPDNVSQDDGPANPVDGPIPPQVAANESTIIMDAESSSFVQPDPPVSVVK